ncbi:response regulator transcription factor [Candidatus Omnitrophota bacterium]
MAQKMKLLIAEDEPDIRLGLKLQLEARGYEVVEAADGEQAVKMVAKHDPDVVILDLMMPKKDGYTVMKDLREQPKWRPIILVSALNETSDVLKGYKQEADYYVTKPYKIDKLIEAIKVMASLIPIRRQQEP